MARLRILKPRFFANEDLAEVSPLGRLLFQGLWCWADREGRLEDRPKRIKVEILPYDDCDVEELLNDLAAKGFILRYEVDGQRYIQVVNFSKHQSPHIKEGPSTIPVASIYKDDTIPAPCLSGATTVQEPDEPICVMGTGFMGNGVMGTGGESAQTSVDTAPVAQAPKTRKRVHRPLTETDIQEITDEYSPKFGSIEECQRHIRKALNDRRFDQRKDKVQGLRDWLDTDLTWKKPGVNGNGTTRTATDHIPWVEKPPYVLTPPPPKGR